MDEVDFYLEDLRSKFNKIKRIGLDKYYLSYSGGKDSHFLYWFIKEYAPEFSEIEVVGINTYMEHHELVARINNNCDRILYPALKPFEIKEKYGSPCFSKIQDEYIDRYQRGSRAISTLNFINGVDTTKFKLNKKAKKMLLNNELHKISNKCCKVLKKDTAAIYQKESGKHPILGVRSSESGLRKTKYKSCFNKNGSFTPIHDLSDELLEKIYNKYNIELPKVYNYIHRTGCMGCPYGSYKKNTEKELLLISEPQFNFVTKYFEESYKVLGIDVEKIKMERKANNERKQNDKNSS